jgi:hypothetical protein
MRDDCFECKVVVAFYGVLISYGQVEKTKGGYSLRRRDGLGHA